MSLQNQHPNELDSALLDAVLNTAVDAIVTIDSRGKILHANRSVEKLFGYKPSDLINQNVSVLMPEPDRSRHDSYVHQYNETGKRKIIGIGRQVLGQRVDGSLIPIDLAISEVRVGDRILYTGIMRDMTERQQTEADLRDAQLRLIQSERLAAIGQMVTGLAHESRNALQRSRACLDMLDLDLETAPEQRDLVRRTRSALVELQTLYEEVRSYAAPIQLGKSRQIVSELCQQVWDNLTDVWSPQEVKLVLNCEACPAIYCDAPRISQVIRNIYENSLAVVPHNSSIYTTCKLIRHGNQPYIQVAFTDDGPGLDEEQRRRIFEPFFTTKTKGTGLGMAICNRIVEAHAGKIYVGDAEFRHPKAHGAVIVMELPV
ncbi:two-component system sensor histidine kinase NtrB [Pirellulaceae bacterium SH501]